MNTKVMQSLMVITVALFTLAQAQDIVPETSAYGAVTVDGNLTEAAWANALDVPIAHWDQKTDNNKFWINGDRYDEADFNGSFKLMYQGQKFYIGCAVTDNDLCVWNDPIKDLPETGTNFPATSVWQWATWGHDGPELYLNLNGAPHAGAPSISGIGAGDSHVKIALDPLYEPSIKPAGAADRWWDYVDQDAVSITTAFAAAAQIGLNINKTGNSYVVEYCIDASQLAGAVPLAEGNHIAFLGYYKDMDTNTNTSTGLETPNPGANTAKYTNLTGYLTKELDLSAANVPGTDASSWGDFILGFASGPVTGAIEWQLYE